MISWSKPLYQCGHCMTLHFSNLSIVSIDKQNMGHTTIKNVLVEFLQIRENV